MGAEAVPEVLADIDADIVGPSATFDFSPLEAEVAVCPPAVELEAAPEGPILDFQLPEAEVVTCPPAEALPEADMADGRYVADIIGALEFESREPISLLEELKFTGDEDALTVEEEFTMPSLQISTTEADVEGPAGNNISESSKL